MKININIENLNIEERLQKTKTKKSEKQLDKLY